MTIVIGRLTPVERMLGQQIIEIFFCKVISITNALSLGESLE